MAKIKYNKCNVVELIKMFQNADNKALEELIKRVQKEIYVIFSHLVNKRADVADLTQETLIKMARSLKKLNNPEKFKSWLNRIIVNAFNDYIKKKKDDYELGEDRLNEIKDKIGCEPGEKCFYLEIEKLIQASILSLPKDLRLAIVLREYEGFSYDDIAKITNATVGTVKSRISRARQKLQKELKEFI